MTARSSGIHFRPQKHILFSNSKLDLSYARTYEGTNERTHTHTHLSLRCPCLGVWLVEGDLGFGSARETVRPAGLLHTHTFLFHQDKHETCKRSLTHRSGSRGVLTHSHHPHTLPHACTQYIPSPVPQQTGTFPYSFAAYSNLSICG